MKTSVRLWMLVLVAATSCAGATVDTWDKSFRDWGGAVGHGSGRSIAEVSASKAKFLS
jgi:hypothetical protein